MTDHPVRTRQRLPLILYSIVLLSALLGFSLADGNADDSHTAPAGKKDRLVFRNHTARVGLDRIKNTYGASFVDVDGDGDDDLVVSNHGQPPSLFLYTGRGFEETDGVMPVRSGDIHSPLVVDIDSDGDRDILFACGGGGDGVTAGSPNILFLNRMVEQGALVYEDASKESQIEYQQWRGRAFLPVPDAEGSAILLFLQGKPLTGGNTPNLLLENVAPSGDPRYERARNRGLTIRAKTTGKNRFSDFDRDGDLDLFIIDDHGLSFYRNQGKRFRLEKDAFAGIDHVESIEIGDLNNDGYPDLYVGTAALARTGDRVSHSLNRYHFVLDDTGEEDGEDEISFSGSEEIALNLLPGNGLKGDETQDIFIGGAGTHPESRLFTVHGDDVIGKMPMKEPGVYLWYLPGPREWHLRVVYGEGVADLRGEITAELITSADDRFLEPAETKPTRDAIFINKDGALEKLDTEATSEHTGITSSVAIIDLDLNGFADIVCARAGQKGDFNGDPLVILNGGNLAFEISERPLLVVPEDDLFTADTVVYGFSGPEDGLPDLFLLNGGGLIPGSHGPYLYFRNVMRTDRGWVRIELQGRSVNTDAIGTAVELYLDDALVGFRELANRGLAQDSHTLHFGLGAPERYDGKRLRAVIMWPDGSTMKTRLEPNSLNSVRQRR
jgi:hypothetical protein